MPLQAFLPCRKAGEDRIATPQFRKFDIEDADLGRPLRAASAAECIGEQLMSEANAQKRPADLPYPAADSLFLRDEPRMLVHIPHVHRATHDPERIIILELRNRFILIEADRIPADTIFLEKCSENAWMLAGDMLEYK